MKKIILISIASLLMIAVAFGIIFRDDLFRMIFEPRETSITNGKQSNGNEESITVEATDLDVPWDVVFLPDGDMLITERSGTLVRYDQDGQRFEVDGVVEEGEGGLLGIALHPDFETNGFVYLYSTTESGEGLTNRVERYTFTDNVLEKQDTLISDIPGASIHDGGKIAFGPDGYLYITTGDANVPENAQDTDSLSGKILRIADDGAIPDDNPFDNATYSYGHRNPQGITWDDDGQLWAVEHGPSGLQSGFDELNRIEAGANYGWPVIQGDETREGMQTPAIQSGADETWAPGGLAHADGSLFFAGLRGQSLYETEITGEDVELKRHFSEEYGRLRAVMVRDDRIYVSTSNTDGRGTPRESDDKVISIALNLFL